MSQIKQLLQRLSDRGEEIYAKIGTVQSTNTNQKTAVILPIDGSAEIQNAYLQVAENGLLIEPKVGSLVACVFVTKELAVVVNVSELKQFQLKIKDVEFQIDQDGFLIKKQDETLAKLISDLLQEIQKMKFTTNTGSTIALVNKPKFLDIENKFKQLLKT